MVQVPVLPPAGRDGIKGNQGRERISGGSDAAADMLAWQISGVSIDGFRLMNSAPVPDFWREISGFWRVRSLTPLGELVSLVRCLVGVSPAPRAIRGQPWMRPLRKFEPAHHHRKQCSMKNSIAMPAVGKPIGLSLLGLAASLLSLAPFHAGGLAAFAGQKKGSRLFAAMAGLIIAVCSIGGTPAMAGSFVLWDPLQVGTEGSADGVNVTASYGIAPNTLGALNMSGPDYNPPGASNQQYVDVAQDTSIAWAFDQPVKDLLLYVNFWRGAGGSAGGPPNGLYTFDQPPTIQSGLADATISGNSLVVTSNTFSYSGILSFPGQLTSLSLLTPATGSGAGNGYTMSFTAVPEPSTLGLLACGAVGGFAVARRTRRRRSI